jgi:hypothetical protein
MDTKPAPPPSVQKSLTEQQTANSQNTAPIAPEKEPTTTNKPRKKVALFIFLISFVILIIASFATVYALAYEKIKLKKFPKFQKGVSYFVQNISFMPKTPTFLLKKTALAHQAVSKLSFDISATVDPGGPLSIMNTNIYDIELKGAVDFSDPQNVIGTVNTFITKEFNIEFKKTDPIIYFKINKFPTTLLSVIGVSLNNVDPLLNKWVSYNTTPLATKSRQQIDSREQKKIISSAIEEINKKYFDDKVLEKISVTSVQENGESLYKISLISDDELIDHLGSKIRRSKTTEQNLSDQLKNLIFEIYIDKKSYYTKKIVLSFDFKLDQPLLGNYSGLANSILPSSTSTSKFAFVASFADFGEEVIVQVPTSSITIEEFGQILARLISESESGMLLPTNQLKKARDAARKSDLPVLQAALEIYYSECQKYPLSLTTKTPDKPCDGSLANQIKVIPTDPLAENGNYYYQSDGKTYNLCAKLEIDSDLPLTCPDPTYNYHLKSQ